MSTITLEKPHTYKFADHCTNCYEIWDNGFTCEGCDFNKHNDDSTSVPFVCVDCAPVTALYCTGCDQWEPVADYNSYLDLCHQCVVNMYTTCGVCIEAVEYGNVALYLDDAECTAICVDCEVTA